MYYTYALECFNSAIKKRMIYIGSTNDLRKRLVEHKSKSTKTTKNFNKIKLIYYEASLNKTDVIHRENQLKTGFGRGYIKRRLKNYLESRD